MGRAVYQDLPIAQLVREYEAGDSYGTIATRYGVGYGTVRRVLIAAGVTSRAAHRYNHTKAGTRTIRDAYVSSEFWDDYITKSLHPAEVAKLRRAVGWEPGWAGPYDEINGDQPQELP